MILPAVRAARTSPLAWVAVVGLGLILLAFACSGQSQPQAGAPRPRDVLAAVADATERLRSVHFSLTHPSGSTTMGGLLVMHSAEGDVAFPDSVRASFQGAAPAFNVAVELKLVQVGTEATLSDPFSGKWRSVEAASLPFQFSRLDRTLAQAFRALREPSLTNGSPVDGTPTYRIVGTIATEVLSPLLPGVVTGKRAKVDLVVGQQDKYPRSIRIEGPLLPDDSPEVVRLLRVSAFDQPITIELPR